MFLYNEPINEAVSPTKKKLILKNKSDMKFISTAREISGQDMFVDLSSLTGKNQINYEKSITDIINDTAKYKDKIILIYIDQWVDAGYNIIKDQCPPYHVLQLMKRSPAKFKDQYKDFAIYFISHDSKVMIPIDVNKYKVNEYPKLEKHLISLIDNKTQAKSAVSDKKSDKSSPNIVDTGEDKNTVKRVVDVSKVTDKEVKELKRALVGAVQKAAEESDTEEEAVTKSPKEIAVMVTELEDVSDGKPKLSVARNSRIASVNKKYLDSQIGGKTVKDLINSPDVKELPKTDLTKRIATINDEWSDVKYINFQDAYKIDKDIAAILYHFGGLAYPVTVVKHEIEDISNAMDYLYNYRVEMEDSTGKRFTLNFDLPKFKNKRFMKLRGNDKAVSGQLLLLPCIKTDLDTVQIVSNYNKIFVRRYGQVGKSYSTTDRLLKALKKYKGSKIKVVWGDNSQICNKYELPVDYIDIASNINRIDIPSYGTMYFDQDVYYSKFKAEVGSIGIPYMIDKKNNVHYLKAYDEGQLISERIVDVLCSKDHEFEKIFNDTKAANKLNFSMASIMAAKIPLAVILGYHLGLQGMMIKAGVTNKFKSKRSDFNNSDYSAYTEEIVFKDGYLRYIPTYTSSMLMNGLCDCDTANYEYTKMGDKSIWLDFLDLYGGRILADGLDNFYDLMIDPITKKVCKRYNIPTDYCEILIRANALLADNKYNRHVDISGNRYRNNEIVAGYLYKCLCKAYTDYKTQIKRGRRVSMSIKRTAVVDAILADPMAADLSILNPLLEIETANTVSFKGLSGMNSDRAYGLDKRTYDDSMVNKLALSTGFASNVGITRQTTIDMNIEGDRGYIKQNKATDLSVTKSLSMSEAVTPFGTTRDDPFRSAMTFIQTSKHSMRPHKSMPLLITNGADEAMAYIASDTYSYKAKESGVVDEVTKDYMIVSYNKKVENYTKELIDLSERIEKNSDGGFYITINLDTDLKKGAKFKKGDIIAYDKTSFSNKVGESDNLAYDVGVFAKIVIMNNDEGFEDSTSISNWMSEAMASDIVVMKDITISKAANVYDIVKPGQDISEGDPLIIFQNAFDENDANMLLKNVTKDSDFVSDLGRIRLRSKFTGKVQAVKIYRTCDIDGTVSDSMKKLVTNYEKNIKAQKAMYKKYNLPNANLLEPDYKLPQTGKMKDVSDAIRIEFYITYNDKLAIGDKTVAQSANKGVVKYIFPEGLEPFTEYRPDEKVHAIYAARSFNARMVTSVFSSGALNKVLVELDRQCKEQLGIKPIPIEEFQ